MKAIVALSGGMDSCTVLAEAIYQHGKDQVEAVGFTYGSKHNSIENRQARLVAEDMGVPFILIDISTAMAQFESNLLKTGGPVPEGHYHESNMSETVVPGRNLIFISVLTGLAWSKGASEIWLGLHQGDHHIYADCRPVFFNAMNAAVIAGSDERVRLVAPYLYGDKSSIIKRGLELGVKYGMTRTCYNDGEIACGKCGACGERLEAFAANEIEDPLPYFSRVLPVKKA